MDWKSVYVHFLPVTQVSVVSWWEMLLTYRVCVCVSACAWDWESVREHVCMQNTKLLLTPYRSQYLSITHELCDSDYKMDTHTHTYTLINLHSESPEKDSRIQEHIMCYMKQ